MTKEQIKTLVNLILTILSAIAAAISTTSCVTHFV